MLRRGAPAKAKAGINGHRAKVSGATLKSAPLCAMCKLECDPGTDIRLISRDEFEVEEDITLCSRECLWDYLEEEVIDDRVEVAKRDEVNYLHQKICPACKARVRADMEDETS